MTLLITAVGLIETNKNDTEHPTLSEQQLQHHVDACFKDAKYWGLPVFKSLKNESSTHNLIEQIIHLLEQGLQHSQTELTNNTSTTANAEQGWFALLDIQYPVLPTELIEHLSMNVYGHQISSSNKFICLHDRHKNYPLLSLIHFDMIQVFKDALANQQTDLLEIISPYMLSIAMPHHWTHHKAISA